MSNSPCKSSTRKRTHCEILCNCLFDIKFDRFVTVSSPNPDPRDISYSFSRLERMRAELSPNERTMDAEITKHDGMYTDIVDNNTKELYRSAGAIVDLVAQKRISVLSLESHLTTSRTESTILESASSTNPTPFLVHGFNPDIFSKKHSLDLDSSSRYSQRTSSEAGNEVIRLDVYCEDFLDFEDILESFEDGMRYFRQSRYDKAESCLIRGLQRAYNLSTGRKDELDLSFMLFCHASSCIALSRLGEARKDLHSVVDGEIGHKCNSQLRCFAVYELARVYLKLSQTATDEEEVKHMLDAAVKYGMLAVTSMEQEPSITNESNAYYAAVHLLSLIYWAKDLPKQCQAMSKLLPPASRVSKSQYDRGLALETANQNLHSFYQQYPSIASTASTRDFLSATDRSMADIVSTPMADASIGLYSTQYVPTKAPTTEGLNLARSSSKDSSNTERASSKASTTNDVVKRKGFHKQVTKGLFWAVRNDDVELLDALLEVPSAEIDTRKAGLWNNETLLRTAAARGHQEICARLLAAGADIDAMVNGQTALDAAIDERHVDVCRLLLDRMANSSGMTSQLMTPLLRAVNCGSPAILEVLAERMPDVNDSNYLKTRRMRTALMHCAERSNIKALVALLDFGADPNGPDPSLTTPLIEAARANSIVAARLLLQRGADLHLTTAKGMTATRAAVGWLKGFFVAWPKSKTWRDPGSGMILQP